MSEDETTIEKTVIEKVALTPPFSQTTLDGLKRRDLQNLCKTWGIKGTGKNTELIEKLLSLIVTTDCHPEKENILEESAIVESVKEVNLEMINGPAIAVPIKNVQNSKIAVYKKHLKTTAIATTTTTTTIKSPRSAKVNAKSLTGPKSTTIQTKMVTKPSSKLATNSTTVKKKFDLQQSLNKSLSYKPHTGPLKPFRL